MPVLREVSRRGIPHRLLRQSALDHEQDNRTAVLLFEVPMKMGSSGDGFQCQGCDPGE